MNGTPSHCGSVTSSGDAIGDAGGRGRELRDRLLPEVVVTEGADHRRREPDDELVHRIGRAATGPGQVDEDGLARVPDGRMLGCDDADSASPVRAAIHAATAEATTNGSRCATSAMPTSPDRFTVVTLDVKVSGQGGHGS